MEYFEPVFTSIDVAKSRDEIVENGYSILGNPLASEAVKIIKSQIDTLAQADDIEQHYNGTESRVWMAHAKSSLIKQFQEFSDNALSKIEGTPLAAYDILAIRNNALTAEDAAHHKGRWHLDSFRRQLKIFVFLSNVTPRSGPLEVLPGSHRINFKLRHTLKGELITPKDLLDGTRKYSHLKETLVERIIEKGYPSKAFDVPAGTVALVDTSAVHRARPCIEGSRYALTSYYR